MMRGKSILAFALSLGAALALTFVLREPQFTDSRNYVLFLLFFSIGLWLTEAIPPFSVGLFILAFLAFSPGNEWFNSNCQNIAKYVNTFSSSVIWLMLGGPFLASAGQDRARFALARSFGSTGHSYDLPVRVASFKRLCRIA